jgi:hypothetical protein
MRFLERLSRESFRVPVESEPTIPLAGITTADIDPETGKCFPDYLERRRARAATENEPRGFGVVDHDVHPD